MRLYNLWRRWKYTLARFLLWFLYLIIAILPLFFNSLSLHLLICFTKPNTLFRNIYMRVKNVSNTKRVINWKRKTVLKGSAREEYTSTFYNVPVLNLDSFQLILPISHSFFNVHLNVTKADIFWPENSLTRYLANMH